MSIKVYPLIYTRTKNVDFVPDFLARPENIDYKAANKFVQSAMKDVDKSNDIRNAVFSVGEYCVCFGITANTEKIAEILGRTTVDKEYLRDVKGRRIVAFIGFAVNKKDWHDGYIPNLKFSNYWEYWEVYLNYLKKQWNNDSTHSEKIAGPEITLDSKLAQGGIFKPDIHPSDGKKKFIYKEYADKNMQNLLDYYMNEISKSPDISFLSGIEDSTSLSDNIFTVISVPENTAENYLKKKNDEEKKSEQTVNYSRNTTPNASPRIPSRSPAPAKSSSFDLSELNKIKSNAENREKQARSQYSYDERPTGSNGANQKKKYRFRSRYCSQRQLFSW